MGNDTVKPGNVFMFVILIVLMGTGALIKLRDQANIWTTATEMFFLLAVVVAGIIWQITLIQKDADSADPPRRIVGAGVFCSIVFVTVIGYSIYAFNDPSKSFTFPDMLNYLGKSLILCLMFSIKTYLGPIFLAGTITSSIYASLQAGDLSMAAIPYLNALLDWVFSGMPKDTETFYYIGLGVYTIYTSGADTYDDSGFLRDIF